MIFLDENEVRNHPNLFRRVREGLILLRREFPDGLPDGLIGIKLLKAGDVCFNAGDNWIGIEIKRANSDLVSSLTSGHLSEQVRAMEEHYDVYYLLVEGWFGASAEGRIKTRFQEYSYPWTYWTNWLAEAQEAGLRKLESPHEGTTSEIILNLYRWWQIDDHKALRAYDKSLTKGLLPAEKMLIAIPGYELGKLKAVQQIFPNLTSYLSASQKERAEAKGIGKRLASVVDEVLGENWRR